MAATDAFRALDDARVPVEIADERFCMDLFDDPEARRRHLVAETWSSHVGRFEDPGLLVEVSPASTVVQRGPCACGEHTQELLEEVGYTEEQIASMVDGRAVLVGTDS